MLAIKTNFKITHSDNFSVYTKTEQTAVCIANFCFKKFETGKDNPEDSLKLLAVKRVKMIIQMIIG